MWDWVENHQHANWSAAAHDRARARGYTQIAAGHTRTAAEMRSDSGSLAELLARTRPPSGDVHLQLCAFSMRMFRPHSTWHPRNKDAVYWQLESYRPSLVWFTFSSFQNKSAVSLRGASLCLAFLSYTVIYYFTLNMSSLLSFYIAI